MSAAEVAERTFAEVAEGHLEIDQTEARIVALGGKSRAVGDDLDGFPMRHIFTPGLYTRELSAAAGSVFTSLVHKTEHPFVVSAGAFRMYSVDGSYEDIVAPYCGITTVGSRRVFVVVRDMVMTGFYATDKTDLEEIERDIYEAHENPLLEDAVAIRDATDEEQK